MKRIMIDPEKCDGCKNCSIACMMAHQGSVASSLYEVDMNNIENEARHMIRLNSEKQYMPIFCRHCTSPECVLACMSGAMEKSSETGHVLYNAEKCGACFMCVMSCPFGVPRPDKATMTKVIKCDFCEHDENGPNCVRACPTKAITIVEV